MAPPRESSPLHPRASSPPACSRCPWQWIAPRDPSKKLFKSRRSSTQSSGGIMMLFRKSLQFIAWVVYMFCTLQFSLNSSLNWLPVSCLHCLCYTGLAVCLPHCAQLPCAFCAWPVLNGKHWPNVLILDLSGFISLNLQSLIRWPSSMSRLHLTSKRLPAPRSLHRALYPSVLTSVGPFLLAHFVQFSVLPLQCFTHCPPLQLHGIFLPFISRLIRIMTNAWAWTIPMK